MNKFKTMLEDIEIIKPVKKHQQHDQSKHGSWANQGFSEEEAARIARMEDVGPSIEDLNSALDGAEQPDLDELKLMVENDYGLFSSATDDIEERVAAAVEEAQSKLEGQETSEEANEQLYNRLYEEIQDEMVDEYMQSYDNFLVQVWMEQNGGGGDVESLTPALDDVYRVEVTGTGRDGLEHTLTSEITSVEQSYDGGILVKGYVENEDGNNLSNIQRSFRRDSNGEWEVEHDYLMIREPDYRGTGFGKEFLRQSEDWYTAKGISSLVVGTADEGAVYWARRGFDFDEKSNARNFQTLNNRFSSDNPEFVSLMNRAVNGYDPVTKSYDSIKPMNTPGFPTPAEFANIGYTKGATKWLASDVLNGSAMKYRKGMSAEGRSLITPSGAENPIDRDGDGFVFDGTSRERPAP